MENLKIRVNNEAESKEAQGYFEDLGAVCCSGLERNKNVNFLFMESGFLTACKLQENFDKSKCKEITLPELRDLVVLKRNNREDANVSDENCLYDLYLTELGELYFYHCGKNKWILSNLNGDDPYYESLKPIEKKEMKEYLRKNSNGTYSYIGPVHTDHVHDFMIEIPEGATYYAKDASLGKSGNFFFRLRSDDFDFEAVWLESNWMQASFNVKNQDVLWQRDNNQTIASAVESSQPEELPFIDDEPSLNDQYAEIEKVRQSAWQKQEGGSHYKNLKIQPMQYALENKLDYAQANVVKYVTRHADKNGKEDLLKAIHNLELMIEFYYGDEK